MKNKMKKNIRQIFALFLTAAVLFSSFAFPGKAWAFEETESSFDELLEEQRVRYETLVRQEDGEMPLQGTDSGNYTYDCSQVRDHGLPEGEEAKATVMVYMIAGDKESVNVNGSYDLYKMMEGLQSGMDKDADFPDINLLVETGGCKKEDFLGSAYSEKKVKTFHPDQIPVDDPAYELEKKRIFTLVDNEHNINWYENQRWYLSKDEIYPARNAVKEECKNRVMTVPEKEDYSPELADFIETSISSYPAERYILILWGEGNGVSEGYGVNEKRGGSPIDVSSMLNTIKKVSDPEKLFDLVYYQTGNSANIENSLAWAPYAHYLMGFEDVSPYIGFWNNHNFIRNICCSLSTQELISEELSHIVEHVGKYDQKGLISAINLDKAADQNTLYNSMDSLGASIADYIMSDPVELYYILKEARESMIDLLYPTSGIIDIKAFCKELSDISGKKDDDNAKKLKNAADDLVVMISDLVDFNCTYHYYPGYNSGSDSSDTVMGGLCIYFPFAISDFSKGNNESGYSNPWVGFTDSYKGIQSPQRLSDAWIRAITLTGGIKAAALSYSNAYSFQDLKPVHERLEDRMSKMQSLYGDYFPAEQSKKIQEAVMEKMDRSHMTLEDTQAVEENGRYYSILNEEAYRNADYLYMNNWFTTFVGGSFGLGMLGVTKDGFSEKEGKRAADLDYLNNKWFSLFGEPVSIYDSSFSPGEDPFEARGTVLIPASLGTLYKEQNVLLEVFFEKGESSGSIIGYYPYDFEGCMEGNFVYMEEIGEEQLQNMLVKPIFNALEYVFGMTYSRPGYIFQNEIGYKFPKSSDYRKTS